MLNDRIDVILEQVAFGEADGLLQRARKALRLAEYPESEALLKRAREVLNRDEAAYFNLLGALQESQKKRFRARRCYAKANMYSAGYAAARVNLQRRTPGQARLGDENQNVWYAQLPTR
jgi:predicted Zn-dependent protease